MSKLSFTVARLSERSTWLGLVGLLSVFGVSVAPALQEPIVTAGVGIASLLGIFTSQSTTVTPDGSKS